MPFTLDDSPDKTGLAVVGGGAGGAPSTCQTAVELDL